jgi:hypothetical protein
MGTIKIENAAPQEAVLAIQLTVRRRFKSGSDLTEKVNLVEVKLSLPEENEIASLVVHVALQGEKGDAPALLKLK